MIAHQASMTASTVLNAQTKRNGLAGPSQLTSEKLKIRIPDEELAEVETLGELDTLIRRVLAGKSE